MEPLRFSVGLLFALCKQRGPQHSLKSFRSIFLLEGSGPAGQSSRPFMRLSSRVADRCSHTLFVNRYVRCQTLQAHCWNLFLDAQSAYYRDVRGRLTGENLDHETFCQILNSMGIAPHLVESILAWAEGPPLFASLNPHQQKFLSALFRAPAFLLKGQQWLHSTRSGMQPGHFIADILFAAVLVGALQGIHARLEVEGLGYFDSTIAASPTWADDVSLPIIAPLQPSLSAEHLLSARSCMRRWTGERSNLTTVPKSPPFSLLGMVKAVGKLSNSLRSHHGACALSQVGSQFQFPPCTLMCIWEHVCPRPPMHFRTYGAKHRLVIAVAPACSQSASKAGH